MVVVIGFHGDGRHYYLYRWAGSGHRRSIIRRLPVPRCGPPEVKTLEIRAYPLGRRVQVPLASMGFLGNFRVARAAGFANLARPDLTL